MKLAKSLSLLFLLTSILTSCGQVDFKKTKGGVPYKIFPSKSGDKIIEGNIVKFQSTVRVKGNGKDTLLGSTYTEMPNYQQVTSPSSSYGSPMMEVLLKAKTGDSIYVVQSIDSFIVHNPEIVKQTPFRKGDQLITTLRVLKVFRTAAEAQPEYVKEQEDYKTKKQKANQDKLKNDPAIRAQMVADDKILQDYFNANHIQAKKTEMGTYVQELTPGQGPTPAKGKFADLKYTGADLSGQVFDSNDKPGLPLLPLQIGNGGAIPGFEDGVSQLTKGEKAKIYLPSPLAYGSQGRMPKIKPNQILVFTIELVDITDAPPPERPMAPLKIDTTQKHK